MKTYLVTGAAGFIGANYLKYILAKHDDIRVVVLDALTYAGNLATISKDIDNERCYFVKGNICDRSLADQLFADYKFDYIVNFAAESHVDRSIDNPQLFLQTNILGTQNLLDAARRAWVTGKDEFGYPTWRKDVRFHQVSTDEVYGSLGPEGYFTEETPLCPHSPYSASKTSADLIVTAYRDTYKMPVTITRCSNNYGPYHFPEKLIPLIIKNILEGKRLPECPRLAVCGRSLQSHRSGGTQRTQRRNLQRGRTQRKTEHRDRETDHRDHPATDDGRTCLPQGAEEKGTGRQRQYQYRLDQRFTDHFRQRPSGTRPALCHRPDKDYQRTGLVSGNQVRRRYREDHHLVSEQSGMGEQRNKR